MRQGNALIRKGITQRFNVVPIHDIKIFLSKMEKRKKHKSVAKLLYNYLLLIQNQSTLSKIVIQQSHDKNS